MDNLEKIMEKIEQPLIFASQYDCKNIAHIKNMGKTMVNLLVSLKGYLPVEKTASMIIMSDDLVKIFTDYDGQKIAAKKLALKKSLLHWQKLKTEIESLLKHNISCSKKKENAERIAEFHDSLAKISLPVQYLKGVGPKMAVRFAAKKINTVDDLLFFLPRTYEDRREIKKINRLEVGKTQTAVGNIISCQYRYYGKKRILEAVISDETANLTAKWFRGRMSYLLGIFKKGTKVIFTGEIRPNYQGKSMIHPDYEILEGEEDENLLNFKRIVPVYSETEGLHQKYIRKIMYGALEQYKRYIASPIPSAICERRNLINIQEALREVHFPNNNASVDELRDARSAAHQRLIYDEFFFFELGMAMKRAGIILEQGISFNCPEKFMDRFYSLLPFDLTAAQKRVIGEIFADMAADKSMNRLLQGDVGSGKTVVSMAAMIRACENNYQAALMAPTEILARQHYDNIKAWADELELKVVLLTGSMGGASRGEKLEQINNGDANIIVGTHALIQEGVAFGKLGLVIIDEQHRFGVMQRATLRAKGINADVLVMTATPIPRTLAMTVYGDLDVSVIDEMPPGKKPVHTVVMGESRREKVYLTIKEEIAKGHQAFIVYPLVEESETLDLKDATKMAQHLQKDIFPDCRVGLIHGRMKEKEKDTVMREFLENKIKILVSTTVIEVGIDVPRASLMIIEHAERFGLSQLHQLRGRVGRRDIPSSCILLADYKCSADARKRLKVMEKTTDGFKLAEEDLLIRGPGDFLGTRQSGLPDFRVASILRDARILNEAKEDAFALAARDPLLDKPEHAILKEALIMKWQGKLDLARTG